VPLNNCENSPPGFLQEPASIKVLLCITNQFFSYRVCLYSVFKTIAAVPRSTTLPTPRIFNWLSNVKGAKGESSLPNAAAKRSLFAQFPLVPTFL